MHMLVFSLVTVFHLLKTFTVLPLGVRHTFMYCTLQKCCWPFCCLWSICMNDVNSGEHSVMNTSTSDNTGMYYCTCVHAQPIDQILMTEGIACYYCCAFSCLLLHGTSYLNSRKLLLKFGLLYS